MFSDQSCVNRTETVHRNLSFPVFTLTYCIVICVKIFIMTRYISKSYTGAHNDQAYYWPTIYRAGTAVVSTIIFTGIYTCRHFLHFLLTVLLKNYYLKCNSPSRWKHCLRHCLFYLLSFIYLHTKKHQWKVRLLCGFLIKKNYSKF